MINLLRILRIWRIWFKKQYDQKSLYYVEGLHHNLFSVGQFCDANLEVGFSEIYVFCLRSSGNDLLPLIVDLTSITNPFKKQPHHSNLSWLNLTNSSMVMARRRSHLNFDYITAFKENIVIVLLNTEVFEGTTSSSCEMRMQTRSQSVQRLFQPSSKVD
ncbi:hypothetical protein Tco_0351933 [Tanacetum coccineum]